MNLRRIDAESYLNFYGNVETEIALGTRTLVFGRGESTQKVEDSHAHLTARITGRTRTVRPPLARPIGPFEIDLMRIVPRVSRAMGRDDSNHARGHGEAEVTIKQRRKSCYISRALCDGTWRDVSLPLYDRTTCV